MALLSLCFCDRRSPESKQEGLCQPFALRPQTLCKTTIFQYTDSDRLLSGDQAPSWTQAWQLILKAKFVQMFWHLFKEHCHWFLYNMIGYSHNCLKSQCDTFMKSQRTEDRGQALGSVSWLHEELFIICHTGA